MAKRLPVALVGGESLLGREIRDVAAASAPALGLRPIAGDEEHAGVITSLGDEPALIGGLDAGSLADMGAVLLAGSNESSRKALDLVDRDPGPVVIDLTGAAEDRPDARLRAPLVESEAAGEGAVHVIAHPAAIALALFFRRLQVRDPIRRSLVQIFAPASEYGVEGMEELQRQVAALLSFQKLPKAVFDAQLGFNLLARHGEEAAAPLERTELRIERHLATLLGLPGAGAGAPMPSLRLIQAPVFHGYSFSAWVQFHDDPGLEALESGLACEWIEVRGTGFDPPNNAGHAGRDGIAVGAIAEDRNQSGAWWFWLVADNLRLPAANAVAVARQLL